MGANAGGTATDAISVAVCLGTVGGAKAGDFHFFACCVQICGDVEQVLGGGGHGWVVWDVQILQHERGERTPQTLRDSEVAGEDEPILLAVIVALQVLPSCLPIHLHESGDIDAVAILGDLLSELCSAHLTLIRIGEILQHPGAEALHERLDSVGAVILQQFLQGFQFFGILVFCEEFFILTLGGGDTPCLQDRFKE